MNTLSPAPSRFWGNVRRRVTAPPRSPSDTIIVDSEGNCLATARDKWQWVLEQSFEAQTLAKPVTLAPMKAVIAAHANKPPRGGNGGHGYV